MRLKNNGLVTWPQKGTKITLPRGPGLASSHSMISQPNFSIFTSHLQTFKQKVKTSEIYTSLVGSRKTRFPPQNASLCCFVWLVLQVVTELFPGVFSPHSNIRQVLTGRALKTSSSSTTDESSRQTRTFSGAPGNDSFACPTKTKTERKV